MKFLDNKLLEKLEGTKKEPDNQENKIIENPYKILLDKIDEIEDIYSVTIEESNKSFKIKI